MTNVLFLNGITIISQNRHSERKRRIFISKAQDPPPAAKDDRSWLFQHIVGGDFELLIVVELVMSRTQSHLAVQSGISRMVAAQEQETDLRLLVQSRTYDLSLIFRPMLIYVENSKTY
ncbi:MAG: hypothetical protein H6857_04570 [Rhodospirillales bacterium]|nr:hypothetical protein [Rhodospirillales bacterium]